MPLKKNIRLWQHSESYLLRALFSVLRFLRNIIRFLAEPVFRAETLSSWKAGEKQFQRSTFTGMNRYPELFEKCREYFADRDDVKILSFGCSTGEEVVSLGKYLPNARIIGVDINSWCIRQCRKKDASVLHSYFQRQSKEFENLKGVDAVFCLAVFQRAEHRVKKEITESGSYKFRHFEDEILLLDQKLKPGGFFFIDRSDYRFMDTGVASKYSVVPFDGNEIMRPRPLFDKYNRKVAEEQFEYRVFVKR